MGACASCLGLGRRDSDAENPERSGLLGHDRSNFYGSNAQNFQRPIYQPDPESLRREREALEGICHAMSDDVVDIFTVLSEAIREASDDDPASPEPQSDDHEMKQLELAYKTVKRGRVGDISSTLNKDERGLRAAKAVMG